MTKVDTLPAALAYAGRGIPVFPLKRWQEGGKAPSVEGGLTVATLDADQIKEWWSTRDEANVGIATGEPAGFWVVDVDGPEGEAALAALELQHGALPETPEQTTARGRHICFAYDPARPIRNSAGKIGKKIDVRGDGGYIAAAPSKHPDGPIYKWHADRRPSKMAFAQAPEWLIARAEKKPDRRAPAPVPVSSPSDYRPTSNYGSKVLFEECAKIRAAQPGTQEVTLNDCSFKIGTLVGGGHISEASARAELMAAGMSIARDWTTIDVAQKVESAMQAGMLKPRVKPEFEPRSRRMQAARVGEARTVDQAQPEQQQAATVVNTERLEGAALAPVTEAQMRAAMAKREQAPADGEPFTIELRGGGLSEEASLSERAVIRAGHPIYQRGRMLVRPVTEEVDAAHGKRTKIARLVVVDKDYMVDCLCRSAIFVRYDARSEKMKAVNPPDNLARLILSRQGEWNFASIVGVITTQTLRQDGSLLSAAGYDPDTRLLLVDPPALPAIPDAPSKAEATAALERLRALLIGFPFASPESRSVALSALITPVVRASFPVAPMHVVRASTPGTGKSYLLDVAAAIAIGRPVPVMAAGRTEEETEKRLCSALLAGQPLISIDNCNSDLGSDALNQAVERPFIDIRPLGRSEQITIEARSTLFATGNNIRLIGDMTRRVIVATLDAEMERPELRRFKTYPVKTVLDNRGQYVADVLTICRAYIVAGRPGQAPPLGSFQGWSDLVRSALMWLGEADPVATMEAAREDDPFLQSMRTVFGALRTTVGVGVPRTSAELIGMAEETHGPGGACMNPELRDALMLVAAGRNGRLDGRQLGNWLRRHKGRLVDNVRLENKAGDRSAWWLTSPGEAGLSGQFQALVENCQ